MTRLTRNDTYWNPWAELEELRREMNRLFRGARHPALAARTEYPPINIWRSADGVAITAELPGIDPDKLDVTVVRDTLTLHHDREPEKHPDNANVRRNERLAGSFTRTVQLPFEVDPQKTEATYEKGVLMLKLERPEEHKPAKISIKAG